MSDAELRKIVNDSYNKFKAFEFGKEALDALDGLKQAKSDLTKVVGDISKKRDDLLAETSKLDQKIKAAEEKAAGIIQSAEAEAKDTLFAVGAATKEAQAKAESKLAETNERIKAAEAAEKYAIEAAKAAQAKLDAINEALGNATNKLKALVA